MRLKNFAALFPESEGLKLAVRGAGHGCQQLVGWGGKPNTQKARQFASQNNLPYLSLEDGFYRSLQPGVQGAAPLSLILDDLGIYYDASKPSRLEMILQDGSWQTPALLSRAETLIEKIRKHQISKYNHARGLSRELPGEHSSKILVVDQTFGDCSVTLGCADPASFKKMLEDALEDNPHADIIIKTHPDVNAGKKCGYLSADEVCSSRIHLLSEDVNPISLLEKVDRVYVVSSQLGFEALLCEKPVKCYGLPFYAGWGLTEDVQTCARRTAKPSLHELFAAACILYPRYLDPETGQVGEIEDVIDYFIRYNQLRAKIPGSQVVCRNFFWWKKRYIRKLLQPLDLNLKFTDATDALAGAEAIMRWGGWQSADSGSGGQLPDRPLLSMEDGFLRSVGLGSDYALPLSLVLDQRGIYFDPQRASDLEVMLQQGVEEQSLQRARRLRRTLLELRLSKYSVGEDVPVQFGSSKGQTIILVPGQVEDDASIRLGCVDIRTNLALLQAVRESSPDAYVVYKPHPDVVCGNRIGDIPENEALAYCDQIVTGLSIASCLEACDEVHTMTSLTGFEALLRGKVVVTYGLPFYAGWGLTHDRHQCPRRTRSVSLDELVAGALIEYPLYIDPNSKVLISLERAVEILMQQKSAQRIVADGQCQRIISRMRGLLQWNLG